MRISSYIKSSAARTRHTVPRALKILANGTRYEMLHMLLAARTNGEKLCVNEVAGAVGLSQSATSHQLALLEAYGVLIGERTGQTTCYDLTNSPLVLDIENIIRLFERRL